MAEHQFNQPSTTGTDPEAGNARVRILYLEDKREDALLVETILKRDGLICDLVMAGGRKQFETILEREHFDLVISDYALPDYNGMAALRLVREKRPHLPFILVSGTLGEEQAVDSLKGGATDYVLKSRLLRLPTAVRRALQDAEAHLQYRLAEEKLRQSQELFRQITENVEDLVAVLDLGGRRIFNSPSYGRLLGEPALSNNASSFLEIHPDDEERIRKLFADTVASGVGRRAEYRFIRPDGTVRYIESQGSVIRNSEGQVKNVLVVSRDITERKETEARLAGAQREMVGLSRQAGMAEVATSILHNLGNVLNSVNVSATLIADNIRKSRLPSLAKVVSMLREHERDLGPFMTADPKGMQVPAYLAQLSEHLRAEQASALDELAALQKNIEHIKDIVARQQSYARISGTTEAVRIVALVEDALNINAGALSGNDLQVVRDFAAVPDIAVDKHKMLQILVNLMQNAGQSCDEANPSIKQMKVSVTSGQGRVRIAIADNGVGIPPENLVRVFSLGFTTKKDGHGFGLHSSALAAKELGGELHVESDGPGHGATFTLELPCPLKKDSHE